MSENLKEAINYLVELGEDNAEPKVIEINGKTYCTRRLSRYDEEPMAEPLSTNTLNSLIEYMNNRTEELRESMIVHVMSPTEVVLLSGLNKERKRETLLRARTVPNGFRFDNYYSQESFVINMQSSFVQTEETALILSVAGNVENKTVANYGDDGMSQKATISKGIAGKADVIVPNPVTLKPFRTFMEVEQPESKFIFRIGEGGSGEPVFKLVEADGGLWKYAAVASIKKYIENNLSDTLKYFVSVIG